MKIQVPPMIIVDNSIHRIINLIVRTNFKSIPMIEQQNKILKELIMIGKTGKPKDYSQCNTNHLHKTSTSYFIC